MTLYSWPLPPEVEEEIEAKQVKIHEKYWPVLCSLCARQPAIAEMFGPIKAAPIAPQPMKLARILGEYAEELFRAKAEKYPEDTHLEERLRNLGAWVVEIVAERVTHLQDLTSHLSVEQMGQAMAERLAERIEVLLSLTRRTDAKPTLPQKKPQKLDVGALSHVRRAVIDPLLEEKGWSILDWALDAEVAYHTAADYLAGKKNPFRSTRMKLAKALGISVNSLPH